MTEESPAMRSGTRPHARHRARSILARAAALGLTASVCAGQPEVPESPAPSKPAPAAPEAAQAKPSLTERARALWSRSEGAADAAALWVRRHLDTEQARALIAELRADAGALIDDAVAQARARHTVEMGIRVFNGKPLSLGHEAWSPLARATGDGHAAAPALTPHAVLLIHGLHEPGDIWNDLVPHLAARGMHVARFDYPNDGPIPDAASRLVGWLRELRSRGVTSLDLVCHSMGGLVARDALTRPGLYAGNALGHPDLPDIRRCVLIGTPNRGSPWARLEFLAEWRDQFQRFLDSPDRADLGHLAGWFVDGRGEAGADLLPQSPFLMELNARPAPSGVAFTSVVGKVISPESLGVDALLSSRLVLALLTPQEIADLRRSIEHASESIGDGPVSTQSADLPYGKTVRIDAAHNSMLRRITLPNLVRAAVDPEKNATDTPAAIPVILEALSAD